MFLFSVNATAQGNESLWTKVSSEKAKSNKQVFRKSQPNKANFFQLDLNGLKQVLQNAPKRGQFSGKSNTIVSFPNSNGVLGSFRIMEASIMHSTLEGKFPNINTYVGQGIDNPSEIIRFSVTSQGLHTMTLSTKQGTEYIDPYTKTGNIYIVYAKRDLPALENSFECGVQTSEDSLEVEFDVEAARNANDGQMRMFRLAMASTIEYSDFHVQAAGLGAGTLAQKKAAVLAAMVVTMNRVVGIYEKDFSLTMELVANNDLLIFITSDSFSNTNASSLINESQTVIDATLPGGLASYDIGHTVSTGGGGLAQLYSPCTSSKARGITGSSNPIGDAYDVDYVAHEMGHQYGGPHTFNGNQGNCSGNGVASNAYEVGSGSTIMAYAGICDPQNVQLNSDAYFHQKSLRMIWANISTGNSSTCGTYTATGNAEPISNAGSDWTIPISTPYILTGSSTDVETTATHIYTWEQYDLGAAGIPMATNTSGPMVRSVEGTTNPSRYIPMLKDLVNSNGGSTQWEVLSSIDNRVMNFELTVRDNDIRGGQTDTDDMIITTTSTAGPFRVTSQSAITTWSPGNSETITWDVAGTDSGIINTPTVDILLSSDGGLTFPTTLATGVSNNGSADIIVPSILSSNCRVMVKGNGHIFFNVNSSKFAIGYNFNNACASFTDNTPKVLPTSASVYSDYPIVVSGMTGVVTDVNVYANVDSNRMNQTYFAVNGPGGLAQYFSTLYYAGCAVFQRDLDVLFDDSAPAFACANPNVGTYASSGDLSVINGSSPNNTWYFRGANFSTTAVTINSFRFDICTEEVVLSPVRTNIGALMVGTLSSGTYLNSHIESTSPNTGVLTNIVYTIVSGQLPANGTVYLNAVALGASDTFTQDDLNTGKVTYTTTLGVAGTDSFRVDLDDQNGGTLTNLKVDMIIDPALGVGNVEFEQFSIYPIPNKGTFTIQLKSNSGKDIEVDVNDVRGRKVYSNVFGVVTDFTQEIKLNSLQAGVYLVTVTDGDYKAVRKIIVE